MLSDDELLRIYSGITPHPVFVPALRAIESAAAQAERHRIYAALEADPGALWRDQGFQEWRAAREAESKD